jgi:hypothetical protein
MVSMRNRNSGVSRTSGTGKSSATNGRGDRSITIAGTKAVAQDKTGHKRPFAVIQKVVTNSILFKKSVVVWRAVIVSRVVVGELFAAFGIPSCHQ